MVRGDGGEKWNERPGGSRSALQPLAPLGSALLRRAEEVGAALRLCSSGRVCIGRFAPGEGGRLPAAPPAGPSSSLQREGPWGASCSPDIWGRGRAQPHHPREPRAGASLPARHWRIGAGEGGDCSPQPPRAGGVGAGLLALAALALADAGREGGRKRGGRGGARVAGGGVSVNRVGVFSSKEERKVCGAGGEGASTRAGPGPGPAAAALGRGAAAGGPPLDFCRGGGIAPSFSSPQG